MLCFDNSGRAGYTDWRIYEDYRGLFPAIWHNYFKEPLDTIPTSYLPVIAQLRKHFFQCKCPRTTSVPDSRELPVARMILERKAKA